MPRLSEMKNKISKQEQNIRSDFVRNGEVGGLQSLTSELQIAMGCGGD